MKTSVLLFCPVLSKEAFLPLAGSASALERSLRAACHFPGVGRIRLAWGRPGPGLDAKALDASLSALAPQALIASECASLSSSPAPVFSLHPGEASAVVSFFAFLHSCVKTDSGSGALFLAPADAPFLDPELARVLLDRLVSTGSEYCFADCYPEGLAPEVLLPSVLETFAFIARDIPSDLGRDAVFSLIRKDINGFDLDTLIAPVDLRPLRLSFLSGDRQGQRLCDALASRLLDGTVPAQVIDPAMTRAQAPSLTGRIVALCSGDQHFLRGLPSYVSVQVNTACPQSCSYCPYPKAFPSHRGENRLMAVADFSSLMEKVAAFSGEAVINPSLWGEPALHPEFTALAASALKHPGLSLLIETSGIGWKPGSLEALAALPGSDRVTWILSLDSDFRAAYASLRGEGFDEAKACESRLESLFPGRVHLQAVRMNENEEDVEESFKSWKKRTERIIIQKYDHFCLSLGKRAVADLSPLKREACWHLKRDLSVLVDGSVPLCRETSLQGGHRGFGNVFTDSLEVIWKALDELHVEQLSGNYPGACADCDEYYTFNF